MATNRASARVGAVRLADVVSLIDGNSEPILRSLLGRGRVARLRRLEALEAKSEWFTDEFYDALPETGQVSRQQVQSAWDVARAGIAQVLDASFDADPEEETSEAEFSERNEDYLRVGDGFMREVLDLDDLSLLVMVRDSALKRVLYGDD